MNKGNIHIFQKRNIFIFGILKRRLIVSCSNEKPQRFLHRYWRVFIFFTGKWYATFISIIFDIEVNIFKNFSKPKTKKKINIKDTYFQGNIETTTVSRDSANMYAGATNNFTKWVLSMKWKLLARCEYLKPLFSPSTMFAYKCFYNFYLFTLFLNTVF